MHCRLSINHNAVDGHFRWEQCSPDQMCSLISSRSSATESKLPLKLNAEKWERLSHSLNFQTLLGVSVHTVCCLKLENNGAGWQMLWMKMETLHQIKKKKSQAVQEKWFLQSFFFFFLLWIMAENGQLYCLISQINWDDFWTLYHVNAFFFIILWSTLEYYEKPRHMVIITNHGITIQ